jgi:hypothetical protein
MEFEIGYRYLLRSTTYSKYKTVLEVAVLDISETAIKFKDLVTGRVYWEENENITKHSWGSDGWHILEKCKKYQDEEVDQLRTELSDLKAELEKVKAERDEAMRYIKMKRRLSIKRHIY